MTDNLWRCTECGWTGRETEMERVGDVKLEKHYWNICPNCRDAEQFELLCDRCDQVVTCGTPTPDGYRNTCGKHQP